MEVIVLAAGKGTRMYSETPKVLHKLGGKPLLSHVLDSARELQADKVHVVVGHGADRIKTYFDGKENAAPISWVDQEQQLGTGHAVQQALPGVAVSRTDNVVLVLYGDVPLIRPQTLRQLLALAENGAIALLTVVMDDPSGLGRIERNEAGDILAIVEDKDADLRQQQIKEINSGILAVPADRLAQLVHGIDNDNAQKEYYLTDIIAQAASAGDKISSLVIDDEAEVLGINDKSQLASAERQLQERIGQGLMQSGVTLRDPSRLDVRGELSCGRDVEIDVNVLIEGRVVLGDGVTIGANCVIKDAEVGSGTKILAGCHIEGAEIGRAVTIGPIARIRPGSRMDDGVKIGNFVETKNATIGAGTKANHLAYIGDAEIGRDCNIGAGTIFCNYDGANKHKTSLGDNVFVGSNCVLVAPLTLESDSFVAAGSAVSSDVPAKNLAVARGKQRNIQGWKRPSK